MTTRRSSEEIELLDTHAGSKTVGWITRKLKARTGIGRSYNAVKCKAGEIGRSVRLAEGYSQNGLMELLGTTQSTVRQWFGKEWLSTDKNGRVSDAKIKLFLETHPSEWHFKRVDEAWVKGMLFS
jgi:hypothetical protein